MQKEIYNYCLEKGVLLDSQLLELFSQASDVETVKVVLEKLRKNTNESVLTKKFLENNREKFEKIISDLPQEKKDQLLVNLGLNFEVTGSDIGSKNSFDESQNTGHSHVQIFSSLPKSDNSRKVEVRDFVNYYKDRFNKLRKILQEHQELDNLVSIDKLSGNRQGVSIIGMVYDKRYTKNKNLMLEIEDAGGKVKVLINQNKPELYEKAEEICLDSVLGFKCSGSREILFANDVIWPDAMFPERKKSDTEEYALFVGDMHYGSDLFLDKSFQKFIDYLNGKVPNTSEVDKIKYIYFVGDLVAGIGIYPGQEDDLRIPDLEQQYIELAEMLDKIPKHIKLIISPGNHEGIRLLEPQPVIDEKYGWPLYQLENVYITPNPCYSAVGVKQNFTGIHVLTYHGFSFPYYSNNVPSLMNKDAMNCPEEIMKYLLQNRHLAPSHNSTQYYPYKEDRMVIDQVPDIMVSGHSHKFGITYYRNVLLISIACWEAITSFQERMGNQPDYGKVPMINLKTRKVKILDFEVKNEVNEIKGWDLEDDSSEQN
ncbi:MAG: metallophosphoesterase [Candidatus Pacearchaeota archaeon]